MGRGIAWLEALGDHLLAVGPLSVWTAIVAALTLYVAWRTLRYSDIAVHMNAPHIVTARDANSPRNVSFGLAGPTASQWDVEKARLSWRSRNRFCERRIERDKYGEEIAVGGKSQGRSVKSPVSPLILSSPPSSDTVIEFTISLKANPRLKRTCACRIEALA